MPPRPPRAPGSCPGAQNHRQNRPPTRKELGTDGGRFPGTRTSAKSHVCVLQTDVSQRGCLGSTVLCLCSLPGHSLPPPEVLRWVRPCHRECPGLQEAGWHPRPPGRTPHPRLLSPQTSTQWGPPPHVSPQLARTGQGGSLCVTANSDDHPDDKPRSSASLQARRSWRGFKIRRKLLLT